VGGIKIKRVIMRRLAPGGDLLAELNELARAEDITLGALSGIGALARAQVGIFDVAAGEYRVNGFDEEMEICALTGNISLKDGTPFAHAHLSLSARDGRAFGGHVMPGCEVFVAEIIIWEFGGAALTREPQAACGGLALWALDNVGPE